MPFERPLLLDLIRRAIADVEARLPGADALLHRAVERYIAKAAAGCTHGLHGHLLWLSKQLFPDTCEDEFALRWARIYQLTRTPAVAADGPVRLTGVNGSVCPAGTLLQRADGAEFTTDAAAAIALGEAVVNVTAAVAGAGGNTTVGQTLSLVSPVAGINSSATVVVDGDDDGIEGGVDQETIAALRLRTLARMASPPKGGGPGDYVAWAREVSGVTRAWQYAHYNGVGTVGVFFAVDDDPAGPIPGAAKVAEVQAHLETKAPVTVADGGLVVYAPVADSLNPVLSVTPDTATVRAAVEAELAAYVRRTSAPATTHLLSQIRESVSIAAGETDHVLTSPAANVVVPAGHLLVLGTVTWV